MKYSQLLLCALISFSLPACTQWQENKLVIHDIAFFLEKDIVQSGVIKQGDRCRVSKELSAGKIYGYRSIQCQSGKEGFIEAGDEKNLQ